MKKFRFKLKTLLMVRKEQESSAQKEVMLAQKQLRKIVEILNELQYECDLLEKDLQQKQKYNINDFRNHFLYIQSLRQKITKQQDDILEAQNVLTIKRTNVKKAMQQKKILENIHDKQHSAWTKEYQSIESKLIDELATIRHIRDKERLSYDS